MNSLENRFTVKIKRTHLLVAIPFGLIIFIIIVTLFAFSKPSTDQISPTPSPTNTQTSLSPDSDSPAYKEMLQKQEIYEQELAKEQAAIQTAYPWFNSLPLQESTYFVYFDAEKKTFIGLLYPSSVSEISIDNQVTSMKSIIFERLRGLSIPIDQLPFTWDVIPEP